MKILVLNCGSSSLKYQLINMENESVMAKGTYERIGENNSFLTHKIGEKKIQLNNPVSSHTEAIQYALNQLINPEYKVIDSLDEIYAVGHRAVHGGEKFSGSVLITDEVIKTMEECSVLAPLHNPAVIIGIKATKEVMPNKTMIGVFDTAFHQTMPKKHYIYPIPYEYYEKYSIRKYGFHGTSHMYISKRIAEIENKPIEDFKIVSCHLGQGASICAIKNGQSIDTSMGLTPLAGIPMGTRSGDIDPSVVTYMMKQEGLSTEKIEYILNKKSGLLGVSGVSQDCRDIEAAIKEGNTRAKLAIDMHNYLVACYIAKCAVAMNGIDTIVFTAGIGENQGNIRKEICNNLRFLGIEIDDNKNNIKGEEILISSNNSKIKVYVIPTNEELMIARETMRLAK